MGDAVTWRNIFDCVLCTVAFVPVLLAPGYCLAWFQNLLGFRTRSLGERLAWGVAFSFGVMPILAVELGKYASLSCVCWFSGMFGVVFLGILVKDAWRQRQSLENNGATLAASGIAIAWTLLVVTALV